MDARWVYGRGTALSRKLSEESVAIFKTLGKSVVAIASRIVLAYIVKAQGEETTAHTLLQEALALGREMESQDDIGRALCGLGHLALRKGDLAQACAWYEESISLLMGRLLIPRNKWALASSLEGIGEIAFTQGQSAWTIQLFAMADAVRSAHGYYSSLGIEYSFYDRTLAQAREYQGEETFAALWEAGRSMPPERALSTGIKDGIALSKPVLSSPSTNLTRRESEVLRLVAHGLTNTQIAEQLFVSMSTIDTHIRQAWSHLSRESNSLCH